VAGLIAVAALLAAFSDVLAGVIGQLQLAPDSDIVGSADVEVG
jgi:hypothetical protein